MAVVESLRLPISGSPTALTSDYWHIESYDPQRIVVAAHLNRDGLLVLSEAFDPGWHAWIRRAGCDTWVSRPILRTNRVMQGI